MYPTPENCDFSFANESFRRRYFQEVVLPLNEDYKELSLRKPSLGGLSWLEVLAGRGLSLTLQCHWIAGLFKPWDKMERGLHLLVLTAAHFARAGLFANLLTKGLVVANILVFSLLVHPSVFTRFSTQLAQQSNQDTQIQCPSSPHRLENTEFLVVFLKGENAILISIVLKMIKS
jgi:hypothetical protein